MGIWNKIWGKIQEQTKIDSIIFDTERKLIDIPTLLNCTIKDICFITEEQKEHFNNQIIQQVNQLEEILTNLKANLVSTTENNTKKQIEFDIKQQENLKAKLNQTKEILNNKDLQLHYLMNYQNRLNSSHFFINNEIINIFEEFHLSPNFEPNELLVARENLENNAYTLPASEKNQKIDEINRYYEILIDPIRLKGYRDIFENPDIIKALENRIKELQEELTENQIKSNPPKEQTDLKTKMETEKNIPLENQNNNLLKETIDWNSIEILDEIPEQNMKEIQIQNEQPFATETINSVNKELLEEQKRMIEEQLIPNLIPLNKQINETHNDLLFIAKNSLLKQHKNLLDQNVEYQKILEELAKLN